MAVTQNSAIIQTVLELVQQKLNETLKVADPDNPDPSEGWVILSNIVDQEGQLFEKTKDKIVMYLANIRHETIISTYNPAVPVKGDQFAIISPTIYIDLFILFYANFYNQSYSKGLAMISQTISFFQQQPFFTPDTLPGLPYYVQKLLFEITDLDVSELNYLMGMVGVKYLPSVYYKVRMIPFQSDAAQAEVPAVQGLEAPGDVKDEIPEPVG